MKVAASTRSAVICAAVTVAATVPLSFAFAQPRELPRRPSSGSSSKETIRRKDVEPDPYLMAGPASKKNATIAVYVQKGGRSTYPRAAEEIATLITKRFKRLYGVNSLAFSQTVGNGEGVGVVYFVDGSLVKTFYDLEAAVKPEAMREVVDMYNAAMVSLPRRP